MSGATAPNTGTWRSSGKQRRARRQPTQRRRADFVALSHSVNGERDERGDREAGDRHQALRHAGEPERRQRAPERLVERQVRAEREHARDSSAARPRNQASPRRRRTTQSPASASSGVSQPRKTNFSMPCADIAREEVRQARRSRAAPARTAVRRSRSSRRRRAAARAPRPLTRRGRRRLPSTSRRRGSRAHA